MAHSLNEKIQVSILTEELFFFCQCIPPLAQKVVNAPLLHRLCPPQCFPEIQHGLGQIAHGAAQLHQSLIRMGLLNARSNLLQCVQMYKAGRLGDGKGLSDEQTSLINSMHAVSMNGNFVIVPRIWDCRSILENDYDPKTFAIIRKEVATQTDTIDPDENSLIAVKNRPQKELQQNKHPPLPNGDDLNQIESDSFETLHQFHQRKIHQRGVCRINKGRGKH